MPGLTRVGDLESGHDGYEPVRLATGSGNVFINGRRAGRVGDVYEAHGGHRDVITSGSPTIFINGLPAARVGDTVRGGGGTGTVGEGSQSIASQIVDIASELSFRLNLIRVLVTYPTEYDKTIRALPDIAKAEAGRAGNAADRQGWLYLSEMFKKWLSAPGSTKKEQVKPFYVTMDWLLRFPRAQEALQDLEDKLFNPPALAELATQVIKKLEGKDQADFDLFSEYPVGKDYFQSSPSKPDKLLMILLGSFGVMNGIDAALASFPFRAVASGTVKRIGPGKYEITVERVGAVLWDHFDFEGEQPLGNWSYRKKAFVSLLSPGVFLWNWSFRFFRGRHKIGHDFIVTSDVYFFGLGEPFRYCFIQ